MGNIVNGTKGRRMKREELGILVMNILLGIDIIKKMVVKLWLNTKKEKCSNSHLERIKLSSI